MAAAALPLAVAAEPAASAGAKLAGDVVAHIASALGTPLLSSENVHYSRHGVTTTKAAIPAWLVVGGAAALWILGLQIGVAPKPNGTGNQLGLRQRPPWTFPSLVNFGGGGGTGGGTDLTGPTSLLLDFAKDITKFLPFFPHL